MDLPKPGLVGLVIRLLLSVAVLWMGYGAVADRANFWNGFTDPLGALGYVVPIGLVTSWVINELTRKAWGQRPVLLVLAGMGLVIGIGFLRGDAFGPFFGTYLWIWIIAFSALLGPALLLAAVLRTPGCEMRSYAHLWAKLTGGDAMATTCPGWIDRFDGIRIAGRF